MAVREIRTDDLDGSDGAEEVSFSFKGRDFEIDLAPKNLAALEKALDKYIAGARDVTGRVDIGQVLRSTRRRKASPSDVDPKVVREWAKARNMQVSDRGRVPTEVVEAYKAATA